MATRPYLVVKSRVLVPSLMGCVQFGNHLRGFNASIFGEGLGNDLQGVGKALNGVLFQACTGLCEKI